MSLLKNSNVWIFIIRDKSNIFLILDALFRAHAFLGYNPPNMEQKPSPPLSSFLLTALILGSLGWGGLLVLLNYSLPTVGPRWLFYFLVVLATTGSALPATAYLNLRFPSTPPATPQVVLREAIWVGIYIPTLAWLQMGRVLTLALAILLALGFIVIEWLLRLRELAQWKP